MGEAARGRVWLVVIVGLVVGLVVGRDKSVRGYATARGESPRLNTKTSTGSPVAVIAARPRARGRRMVWMGIPGDRYR